MLASRGLNDLLHIQNIPRIMHAVCFALCWICCGFIWITDAYRSGLFHFVNKLHKKGVGSALKLYDATNQGLGIFSLGYMYIKNIFTVMNDINKITHHFLLHRNVYTHFQNIPRYRLDSLVTMTNRYPSGKKWQNACGVKRFVRPGRITFPT